MLGHYLRTIAHNLIRSKLVTLIHVVGLGVGLACFVVSFVFVRGLRTSDMVWRNSGRIYAVTQELWMGNAANPIGPPNPGVAPVAAPYLRTDFPQLEAVARAIPATMYGSGRVAVSSGEHNLFLYDFMVDPDFLKIFDLPFVAGDPGTALAGAGDAIITAAAARRVFGTTDVLGKRLLIDNQHWITVRAVIAGVPQPSHMGDTEQSILRFDILTRMVPENIVSAGNDWDEVNSFTYVLLPAHGRFSLQQLRAGLHGFSARHMPRAEGHSRFDAVPVSSIRMSRLDMEMGGSGSVVGSLALLDALVLLVACFNYANLAAAVALRRGREIALRKVVGANRRQLVLQSLLEAAAVSLLGVALAFVLVFAATPPLDTALPLDLQLSQLARPGFWLFFALLISATTLLAGAYPAIVLSRLRPAEAMRSDSHRASPRWGFKTLVAAQFAVAGFLIVMVVIIQEQNRLMTATLPELTRAPTVVITTSVAFKGINIDTLRTELEHSPYVRSVTTSDNLPWDSACCWLFNLTRTPGAAQSQMRVAANVIGYHFFETTGLRLLAGRTLSRERGDVLAQDDLFSGKREIDVVVDRSLASRFGWSNPADAIGKTLYRPALWGGVPGTLRIVGVVENGAPRLTAIESTRSNVYLLMPDRAGYPLVRIDPHHIREAVAHIESAWRTVAPHLPFEWRFADDLFTQAYSTFSTISTAATGITAFAFAIALMGLAGMAIHVTTGRLREVGIRKTLGAGPRQVIELLLLDFAKPIVIANLIAWPFAWFAARTYLSMFLSRTEITALPFIASLAATIAITCLAVSGQALRAARVEPAMVLRYQ